MADKENLESNLDPVDEQDKPITSRQLNQALTNYRRQIEKDMQKVLQGIQFAQPKEESPKDENLSLREQIKALQEKDRQREAAFRQETLGKTSREHLAKNGIDSRYLEQAFRVVRDDITFDTDGQLVMKDSFGVQVPLAEALSSWAKSEQAEIFRAAKAVGGSGGTASHANPNLPAKPAPTGQPIKTVDDARNALKQALLGGGNLTR